MALSQIITGSLANNITISTTGNVSANIIAVGSSVVSPVQSFKNRIINGGMAIDQRNAGANLTFTAAAALAYSVDRWYGYCTGANVIGRQVAGVGTNQFMYRFAGASSVTAIGFGQRIEQNNCFDMANTTVTLSADLQNSLLTTVTWTAYYANTADTFGSLASPTRTQISNGTFTVSSTMSRYSTSINIPAAANTGLEIVLSVGAQTSGYWNIGAVQLESGGIATPFERRFYAHEIALCQRYYEVAKSSSRAYTGDGYWGTQFVHKVEMRATPTIGSLSGGNNALPATFQGIIIADTFQTGVQWTGSGASTFYCYGIALPLSAEL